jgi:hypothetical protein
MVHGILHCGVFHGAPGQETGKLGRRPSGRVQAGRDRFHTYAVEWDRRLDRGASMLLNRVSLARHG